jgi:ATP adenylyltransferase
MRYVSGETHDGSCIFCTKPAVGDDVSQLILARSDHSFVIMNLYPYNSGHVMVVPFQHAADLTDLSAETHRDLWDFVPWITAALKQVLRCDGFNIGLNLGSVAGAGVSEHLHIHIVPRWEGDANFMPVLASTMVMPELIPVTYAKIRAELELSGRSGIDGQPVVPQAGAIPVTPDSGMIALRRATDGTVVLPKGHLEPGEAAWQAAIREVDEEMGLLAMPAGWGGRLDFEVDGQRRRVSYLIVTAEPGPAFEDHLDNDTMLYAPGEGIDALSHAPAKELLRSLLPEIERVIEEAG